MAERDIGNYLRLRIEEADARLRAVAQVVGHSTSKGNTGEDVLRDVIASFLPVRCEVSTGFVVSRRNGADLELKQIDIIVYSRNKSVPLYRDRNLVVVTPDMPQMALESKMAMHKTQLKEAIENIETVKRLRSDIACVVWSYTVMTLDTLKKHLPTFLANIDSEKWPDQILNLERGYVVSRKKQRHTNGPEWTAFHGRKFVAKSLFQTILFSADVDNLTPLIAEIKPDRSEQF